MTQKKGIMLRFLVTVLIALIVFIPTCWFVSNIFNLSDQASDNFVEFTRELQDFAEAPNDERKSFVLIMDKDTSITIFDSEEKVPVFRERSYTQFGDNVIYESLKTNYLAFPEGECESIPCICLCRKYADRPSPTFNEVAEVDGLQRRTMKYDVSCRLLQCKEIPDVPVEAWSYYSTENDARRSVITLTKQGGISISSQREREYDVVKKDDPDQGDPGGSG